MSIWTIDAFGCAMSLIWKMPEYQAEPHKIEELTIKMVENFSKLAPQMASQLPLKELGEQFYAQAVARNSSHSPMTPTQVLVTPFFQSMQKPKEERPPYYKNVRDIIALHKLEVTEDAFPSFRLAEEGSSDDLKHETNLLKKWTARLLVCYMTEPQVTGYCNSQVGSTREMRREKVVLGEAMQRCITSQRPEEVLTREGFQAMSAILDRALSSLESLRSQDNPAVVLDLTARYLNLFGMNRANPLAEGRSMLRLLPFFALKAFPNQPEAKRYPLCPFCGT